MARQRRDDEGAQHSNRGEIIRDAVQWIAEKRAEVKALNAEIAEYKSKVIKGDLGFKLADFNAVYRISQLEDEDRDKLLDTLREGFAALEIGGQLDWLGATDEPEPEPPARRRGRPRKAAVAEPNAEARLRGHEDGLMAVKDHAARFPPGQYGHADYVMGVEEGKAERERVMALGAGDGTGTQPAA